MYLPMTIIDPRSFYPCTGISKGDYFGEDDIERLEDDFGRIDVKDV